MKRLWERAKVDEIYWPARKKAVHLLFLLPCQGIIIIIIMMEEMAH
jgi:hypothetical protein